MTYREVCDLSKDFAGYLQSLPDLKAGDRVAIMMPNLQQYIVSLLGILRAGMIAVNVNPLYTSHELGHQLTDSQGGRHAPLGQAHDRRFGGALRQEDGARL